MMPKTEELVVITKTYDLILWSCQHTSRFPRQHRVVLGERIERNLYELLETLIQAKYTRVRTALLEQANLKLEILRFQVRLAKDRQCLRINSYEFASQSIDEIGSAPFGEGVNNSANLSTTATDRPAPTLISAGNSTLIGNAFSVPEPSTLLLALFAVLGMVITRCARRHYRLQTV